MKAVGSQATPEVIATWSGGLRAASKVHRRAPRAAAPSRPRAAGVSYKVARRRLRNYEAIQKAENQRKRSA